MGYKIEALPGESIIVETWDADFKAEIDGPRASQEMIRMMETLKKSVVVIVDMRAVDLTLDDIMNMAQAATSKTAPGRHPLQRRRIIVTDDTVVSMAAKGLDSAVFNHLVVDIATSMEDALKMARQG